jgi:glycosyltransferase involved in cell wall biosynthesis
MKKIGIFDPYLDTLGGHERYCFDIAAALAHDHHVEFFWDDPSILNRAQDRFHIKTSNMHVTPNIFRQRSFGDVWKKTRQYDAIFFVSDGSIPFLASRQSFLLFEFPVGWVNGKSILNQIKIKRFTKIFCNSLFVKKYIDKSFGINSHVLTPGIDLDSFVPGKKDCIILSVGRFTTGMNTKKQEILIDSFKRLCNEGLKGWKLVLAGGMLAQDESFVDKLRAKVGKYPIDISPNISFADLQSLYGKASIYWHAAGFGEDLVSHPERAEHFGISTIEAMSAGDVPVVYAGGGQKDIVGNWVNGFTWDTQKELLERTAHLIQDSKTRTRFSKAAQARSKAFSKERFFEHVRDAVK